MSRRRPEADVRLRPYGRPTGTGASGPHVAEVLVVSPNDTGIRQARAKTDRLDARTLAKLLASGELDAVWMPDRRTQVMRRRLQRRGQLVWARSRAKNQINATRG